MRFRRSAMLYDVDRGGKNASDDDRLRRVATFESWFPSFDDPGWKDAQRISFAEAARPESNGRVVRVVASVVGVRRLHQARVRDPSEKSGRVSLVGVELSLEDARMPMRLPTLPLEPSPMSDRLVAEATMTIWELRVRVAALPVDALGTSRPTVLEVLDARPLDDPLALLEPDAHEIAEMERWLAKCRRGKIAPWVALRNEALAGLGIQVDAAGPAFADAIDTVALMPYAIGDVGDHVGALSLKVVSPPGQGKGQLVLLGRALFARVADPLTSDVTMAGLLGPSVFESGAWTQQSGALTHSNFGLLALQDLQAVEREARRARDVLARLFTTGVIQSGKSSGTVRGYRVCTIVDANRKHHLATDGEVVGPEFALLDDTSLDSRFDVIVEIMADDARSWEIGAARIDGLIDGRGRGADEAWIRSVQLRAAMLASRHRQVNLKPVRKSVAALHRRLREAVVEKLAGSPLVGDLGARLTTSILRIVSASARGSDRDAAHDDDVAVAERLLGRKIDSLAAAVANRRERAERRRALHAAQTEHSDSARAAATRGRRAWLLDTFGGREVEKSEIHAAYRKGHRDGYAEMTLYRDLVAVGARAVAHGRWMIPGASEEDSARESTRGREPVKRGRRRART